MDKKHEEELVEAVLFIKDRMATKEDIREVRDEVRRVDTKLENFVAHETDKRKGLEVRVSALEASAK